MSNDAITKTIKKKADTKLFYFFIIPRIGEGQAVVGNKRAQIIGIDKAEIKTLSVVTLEYSKAVSSVRGEKI